MGRLQSPSTQAELRKFIIEEKEILFQVMCRAGEFSNIVVRNQAQLLFCQVLTKVLEFSIPFREEIEVLYVKLLLKPLEQLDQKMAASTLAKLNLSKGATSIADKDKMQI